MNDQAVGAMPQVAAQRPQPEAEPKQASSDKMNDFAQMSQEELLANFLPLYVGMQNAQPQDVTDFEEVISKLDISKPNRKRLRFVLYELLQNTLQNQLKGYEKESKFFMYEDTWKLKIEISNYVQGEAQIEKIKKLLNKANIESFEELHDESKGALITEWYSKWWWAGRWFYEIAQKIRKIDPEAKDIYTCDDPQSTDIKDVYALTIHVEFALPREWHFKMAA